MEIKNGHIGRFIFYILILAFLVVLICCLQLLCSPRIHAESTNPNMHSAFFLPSAHTLPKEDLHAS